MKKSILILLSLVVWCMTGQVCVAKNGESDYYITRAIELVDEGNYDEAIEILDKHLEDYPKSDVAYTVRSAAYVKKGIYDSALLDLNKAIKYWTKNSRLKKYAAYWGRARAYADLEMYDKAIADYETVYKILDKTEDSRELVHEILYSRAQIYYDLGDYEKSDADYKLMLKHNESDVVAMAGLARNMIKREEYDKVIDITNRMEKLNAEYTEAYRKRMEAYYMLKEYKKAIDNALVYLQKAENVDEDEYNYILKKDLDYALLKINSLHKTEPDNLKWRYLRIAVYNWKKECSKVIDEYTNLMQEYGAIPVYYYYRSISYASLGAYELAIADMNKYIEAENELDIIALTIRAGYYESNNQYAEAIADYSKIIDNSPMLSVIYRARGWVYECLGDYQSALADYNTGLTVDDKNAELYYMRGRLYHFQGKKELAELDLTRVLECDTIVNTDSRRQYALLFLGRNEEATQWMDSIVAANVDDDRVYYEKACLLSLMGRTTESLDALKTALEKGYMDITHIEKDRDLDAIKSLPAYKTLIDEYRQKQVLVIKEQSAVSKDSIATISEVPMKKMYSGVYEIGCEVNGLPLKFVFDTGASAVTISSVEAQFMLKNGYLKTEDIKGKEYFTVATGEISEGTIIRLKEIKIGDAVLRNVEASVVHNQQAPLLLGQTVLERFGTITIDNINSKLVIKQ